MDNSVSGIIVDQSLKDCLIIMIGDVDHLIRMRIADTMATLYGAGEALMSCDQQEAIYQQVTNTLQNIITLNVSMYSVIDVFDQLHVIYYTKQKHLGCKKSVRPIRSHNGYISDQKL